jgi:WD40 repeat protein
LLILVTDWHKLYFFENLMAGLFISYSRKDKDFAKELYTALKIDNHEVWVDWVNIPPGADWRSEIKLGIEKSSSFVFIISPDSILSKECELEVQCALDCNKKIIPVVRRSHKGDERLLLILRKYNWIYSRDSYEFSKSLSLLKEALKTDLEHVNLHTSILMKALEWERQEKRIDYLLRGVELDQASQWLEKSDLEGRTPTPTKLQISYIFQSSRHQTQEIHRWKQLYQEANKQRQRAENAEIDALNSLTEALLLSHDQLSALLSALRAGLLADLRNVQAAKKIKSLSLLHKAIVSTSEYKRIRAHYHPILSLELDELSGLMLSCSEDQTAILWSLDGEPVTSFCEHRHKVTDGSINGDKGLIATSSYDQTIRIWDFAGKEIFALESEDRRPFLSVAFSRDGQLLAAGSASGAIYLWDHKWHFLRSLKTHKHEVCALRFDSQSKALTSLDKSGTIIVWNLDNFSSRSYESGYLSTRILTQGSTDKQIIVTGKKGAKIINIETGLCEQEFNSGFSHSTASAFDSDQNIMFFGDSKGFIREIDENQKEIKCRGSHQGNIRSLHHSKKQQCVVSAGDDGTIRFWKILGNGETQAYPSEATLSVAAHGWDVDIRAFYDAKGMVKIISNKTEVKEKYFGRKIERVTRLRFSPDNSLLAVIKEDSSLRLWNLETNELNYLRTLQGSVRDISFSLNGACIATANNSGFVEIHEVNPSGSTSKSSFYGDDNAISSIATNADGSYICIGNTKGDLSIWNSQGIKKATLKAHVGLVSEIQFDQKGGILISAGNDATIRVWKLQTNYAKKLIGHEREILGFCRGPFGSIVSWSKDGTVRLWSLDGHVRSILMQLKPAHPVLAHYCHKAGELIVLGANGNIHSINLDLQNLLRQASQWMSASLNEFSDKKDEIRPIRNIIEKYAQL